ncbi:MAG: hypothetical protein RIT24_1401 [Planctomycetota bacterium]
MSSGAATPDRELAKAVERLSDLYTTGRGALAREQADAAHLQAKREYFLASDAPKVALALDECAARDDAFARIAALETVRVVDLGAGVGATSVGFLAWLAGARAARGVTCPVRVELHAIELGEPAARALEANAKAAAAAIGATLALKIEARDFRRFTPPACDIILCQTAINELLVGVDHERETVQMVSSWSRSAPTLVIEPALKLTTRALMSLRDAVLALGGAHVVAPCPHQHACPMRAREADWCHEARRIEPTPRVAAIDRIVGRRDERALFAFLATAPGEAPAPPPPGTVRLVTDTLGSRGKTERVVCRSDGELRLMRLLDREVRDGNRAFLDAERGSVLAIEPLPSNDRISPEISAKISTPRAL